MYGSYIMADADLWQWTCVPWWGDQVDVAMIWAAFRICLRVNSSVLFAQCVSRVCFRSASEVSPTSNSRQKASLKWPLVPPMRIFLLIANGAPPHGGCHFEKSFQPISVVVLISCCRRLRFSRQHCFQSRETNQISRGSTDPGDFWMLLGHKTQATKWNEWVDHTALVRYGVILMRPCSWYYHIVLNLNRIIWSKLSIS